jgi:hypothetical protein
MRILAKRYHGLTRQCFGLHRTENRPYPADLPLIVNTAASSGFPIVAVIHFLGSGA